jgi:hypothetical protein
MSVWQPSPFFRELFLTGLTKMTVVHSVEGSKERVRVDTLKNLLFAVRKRLLRLCIGSPPVVS